MASHGMPRASGGVTDRSEAARKKEARKIETYKGLVEELQQKIKAEDYSADTLVLTSNLLSQNPEYYTVWNNRRLLLQHVFSGELAAHSDEADASTGLNTAQQEILLLLKEDLAFLLPLLKNFPKCYWIWNHRAWLLRQASEYLPISSAKRLWQEELGLVGKMLGLDSRNFHGWSYRRECVKSLETLDALKLEQDQNKGEVDQESKPDTMTEQEFAYTTKMIMTNLSNFSAWHNRSQLIPKLLRERNADSKARRKLLDDEFDFITQALYTDPYDQSLWFYHSYLITILTPNIHNSAAIVLDLTNQERLDYLEVRLDTLKDILEGADDCKYIYQALLTLAAQYLDIEAGNKKFTSVEMNSWLEQLEKLDPLRQGRWQDLRTTLNL